VTKTEPIVVESHRALDALVATEVMGLDIPLLADSPVPPARRYSTDIAAAWEVVEELDLSMYPLACTVGWRFEFDRNEGAEAETAPLAICLAALKAKGINVTLGLPETERR